MRFDNERVYNFEGALRGMRNPLESWAKSDSKFGLASSYSDIEESAAFQSVMQSWAEKEKNIDIEGFSHWLKKNGIISRGSYPVCEYAYIGPNDMNLAQRLIRGGSPHRKFMRQIFVSVDITAPIYWWKEFDTYKVSTVANSTSTMHKLSTTPITIHCFERDDYEETLVGNIGPEVLIAYCEGLRQKYMETKDKRYWKELIRWLPESWLQTRTVTMNYENLYSMVRDRKGHKLTEWQKFVYWVTFLPYANELIFLDYGKID